MGDHILVVESGQNDGRGAAVMAAAKQAIPGKTIRFVVNSHAHFDHAGGLGAAVAEGATILTHRNNEPVLERLLAGPRTLIGDSLSKVPNRRKDVVQAVGDRDIRKGSNGKIVELHHVPNEHSDGMLVVYLPAEKLLWTADVTIVNPTPVQLATLKAMAATLDRLKLDYDDVAAGPPAEPRSAAHQGRRREGRRRRQLADGLLEHDGVAALLERRDRHAGHRRQRLEVGELAHVGAVLDDGLGHALFQVEDLRDLVGGCGVDRHAAELRHEVVVDGVELLLGAGGAARDHLLDHLVPLGRIAPALDDLVGRVAAHADLGELRRRRWPGLGGRDRSLTGRSMDGRRARRGRRDDRRAERDGGEQSASHGFSTKATSRLPAPATTYCRPSSS